MKKIAKLKCERGCEHELIADTGETFHTFINGKRYNLHTISENSELTKLFLHDEGPFHVGYIIGFE
jgi:hypothetical protein